MHRVAAVIMIALILRAAAAGAAEWPQDSFVVLCYHEIRDDARQRPDAYTLESAQLALQFEWLRSQGYHVVRLDDVIAARAGTRPLPPRAVLITFDDGLESVYTRAFPLLQAFGYPAIVALVGGFDFYQSKFNRVTQARRQPGSSFKPFVYAAAFDKGFTPASVVLDAPIVLEQGDDPAKSWRPKEDSNKFFGPTRLREALVRSRNLVSVRLMREMAATTPATT